ncbi:MAG: acyltransferase [Verrucomicrobia bacterium]|nr:acyltransferase [Verrucomicrobiota bacterium]
MSFTDWFRTPNPPCTLSKPRNLALLDYLRCLAILLVVFRHLVGINFHWQLPWVYDVRDFSAYGLGSILVHLFYIGWAGVPLFFVVSGFCIHWSCLRLERFGMTRFFWQRFWRIYPAYITALILFTWVELKGNFNLAAGRQFFSHVFLIQNLSTTTFWGINGPFWSVAVEVQLYLLYPVLLAIRRRSGWRGCFLIAGSLSLLWRVFAVTRWGWPDHSVNPAMTSPLMTWADWMVGAWIAECYGANRRAFPPSRILLPIVFIGFLASTIYRPLTVFSFSLAGLSSAIWLDQMLHRKASAAFNSTPSAFVKRNAIRVGLISYSVYLWHEPILIHWHAFITQHAIGKLTGTSFTLLAVVIPIVFAIIVAYLSYRLIERPGIQLGRWLLERFTALPRPDSRILELAPSRPEAGIH